jgi:hypothetical protein
MSRSKLWITIATAAVLLLMAGAAGAIPASLAPAALLDGAIHYQGRLTDDMGNPLNGTYPMQFQIYDDPVANTLVWDSGVINVDVDQGLFEVKLAIDPADFDGQGLWLQLHVDGELLTPRQELLPVPYALSLRPGAEIRGEPTGWEGWVVNVEMEGAYPLGNGISSTAATGAAVAGSSPGGWGLRAYTEEGYAVYGVDDGIDQARGYGGYFTSNTGIGLYGHTSATTSGENPYAPGVFGESENGVGVYGAAHGPLPAIQGIGWGDGRGVEGGSYYSTGVGVRGISRSSGSGVWGDSDWIAVYAESISSYGIYAETGVGTNNYGLYTPDNIYSLNYNLAGSIMHVVQNGGEQALEPGDVVVLSGMAAPLEEGGPPVIQVAPATSANSTAVAGVVYRRFDAKALQARPQAEQPEGGLPAEVTPEGPVPAGEYLLLVVEGPVQVKASALGGAIRPGDLVSSAGEAGYAARAAEVEIEGASLALPGTVVGKALEPLAADQALIYVFVTLQ